MNYQTVSSIKPVATTGVWQFDATMLPHPVQFMAVTQTDTSGTTVNSIYNSQCPLATATSGTTIGNLSAGWIGNFTRWRLAYAGLTCYYDAPELSNQGTLVVAQSSVEPILLNVSSVVTGGATNACAHLAAFAPTDKPNYSVSQSMPNSYFNQAKFGCYIPLKLTQTAQKWYSKNDLYVPNAADWNYTSVESTSAATVPPIGWPFYGAQPTCCTSTSNFAMVTGDLVPALCNDMVANISGRNLSTSGQFSLFFRYGFEVQVSPGASFTPEQVISPAFDLVAMRNYYLISRAMKDAYPADYNDLGKIWTVIKNIASTVAPILSVIPHPIAQGVGQLLNAVTGADSIRKAWNKVEGASDKDVQTKISAVDLDNAKKTLLEREENSIRHGKLRIRRNVTPQNTRTISPKRYAKQHQGPPLPPRTGKRPLARPRNRR